jgi:iron-sulfur cluster repair protein YtfE (RIC family)
MSQACGCGCGHGGATAAVAGGAIAPEQTIEMVGKRVPGVLGVLRELGIDTCCGGGLTVAQAAASAGIPAERLLRLLRLLRVLTEPTGAS